MIPKPSKAERKAQAQKRKDDLQRYREVQAILAIKRDGNCCVFCFFLEGKKVPRADVHHVYGRGREAGDWREQYTSLVCTCRAHHPLPIKTPGGNAKLAYVEQVLEQANANPINPLAVK